MSDKDLKELQNYGLEITIAVDKFCKKNKIKYFLSEGTLLGAIRHNGFIPWDDDIDLMMLRKDFDKFIELFSKNPPKGYEVEFFNTSDKYWLSYAKVKLTRKTKFITPQIKRVSNNLGPRIDIFPLDFVPEQILHNKLRTASNVKILKKTLFYKQLNLNPSNKKRKIIKVISKFIPYKFIVKKLDKNMRRFNDTENNYVINYGSSYSVKKEVFPAYMFEKTILVDFEGYKLPVSSYYDEILSQIYGDYMKLPPESERVAKHSVIVEE